MSIAKRRGAFDRVLLDLNTQCDFLLPRGALPVANRAAILANIRQLMNWGRVQRLPIISTLEAHRPGEATRGLPQHCLDRSQGQRKLPFTLMPRRILLHGDNTLDLPLDLLRRFQQVIFTKRDRDFLSNPKADRMINNLRAQHIVVFGVVTEHCVKAAVLALLIRQFNIVVVQDACGYWSAADAEQTMRQLEAKGALMVTTQALVSGEAEPAIQAMIESRRLTAEPELEDAAQVGAWPGTNGKGRPNGKHLPINGKGAKLLDADRPPARAHTPEPPALPRRSRSAPQPGAGQNLA